MPRGDSLVAYVEEDQEAQGEASPLEGQPRQAPEHGARLTSLRRLVLGEDPQAWSRLGLEPDGSFELSFEPMAPGRRGLVALGIESDPALIARGHRIGDVIDVDGVEIRILGSQPAPTRFHRSESIPDPCGIDHVVVLTEDLERTCGAVECRLGADLRRIREPGGGIRQGFHRLGAAVLEVVQSPQAPAGPARMWGMALTVTDLDATAARLGPSQCSAPREAVQPGRRIATITREAGLYTAVALMTSRADRPESPNPIP